MFEHESTEVSVLPPCWSPTIFAVAWKRSSVEDHVREAQKTIVAWSAQCTTEGLIAFEPSVSRRNILD